MNDHLAAVVRLLSCPDDGSPLHLAADELECASCGRCFSKLTNNTVEILPRRRYDATGLSNAGYLDSYGQAFGEHFHLDEARVAWGAEETASESWVRKRRRQVVSVRPLVTEGIAPRESVLCDIAAGAGYYSFAYAHLFGVVIHCDLSVDNLSYAWCKARKLGIENIVFVRADYFALPFRHSLDRILCFDTLIRGGAHELMLLAGIVRALKPEGRAVVDFHNWWHNPLRRLGLLPNNFCDNQSYSRSEAKQLLRSAGIQCFSHHPFLQEFDLNTPAIRLLSRIFPSTRLIYRFSPSP